MRPTVPPAVATWFLEHLVLGNKNEALTGDLLEEFQQRRSVAWYWRQVLGAIFVGFSNELRAQWLAFAMVWACAVSVCWELIIPSPPFQYLGRWVNGHQSPERYIYGWAIAIAATVVIVSVSLSLYLAIMHSFNLPRFTRGLLVGVLAVVLEHLAWAFLARMTYSLVVARLMEFLWTWFSLLPLFLALLLSMWTAWPNAEGSRATGLLDRRSTGRERIDDL
jgi:hypothetical protein